MKRYLSVFLILGLLLTGCSGSSEPAAAEPDDAVEEIGLAETEEPEEVIEAEETPDQMTKAVVVSVSGSANVSADETLKSGTVIKTEDNSSVLLQIGDDQVNLDETTEAEVNQYGEIFEVTLLHGEIGYWCQDPDTMRIVVPDVLKTVKMNECGYIFHADPKDEYWNTIEPYLGDITVDVIDDGEVVIPQMQMGRVTDFPLEVHVGGDLKLTNLSDPLQYIVATNPALLEKVAEVLNTEPAEIKRRAGIFTEPVINRTEYPDNGTYSESEYDENGDEIRSGIYSLDDDSIISEMINTYENHKLVMRVNHEPQDSRRDNMVETYTYYDNGDRESLTQTSADGSYITNVYDHDGRSIIFISGQDEVPAYRRETTFKEGNAPVSQHEENYSEGTARDTVYLENSVYALTIESRSLEDDTLLEKWINTYYDGTEQAKTERHEDYRNGTYSETTYSETGEQTGYENGNLE